MIYSILNSCYEGRGPRGVMVKVMDWNCSKWVQIPVGLLRSLLDKYP